MAAKFEVKKSTNGQYLFNLKAANGEFILTSELYHEKQSAEDGVASVRKHCPEDTMYERKRSSDNQYYFVLRATNGQTIGRSELYKAKASMEKGIASVKRNAPAARLADISE